MALLQQQNELLMKFKEEQMQTAGEEASGRSGRSLVVAIDHGYAWGPMKGIVDIAGTISKLDGTGLVDAWLLTKGIFRHAFNPKGTPGVILRSSGGATITGPDITNEG